jgi:predicted MFS family arabinose efflux permease
MAYLLLPRLAGSLASALLGLFLVYITYDFSIVSALPMLSELAPQKRGTLLALNVSAMAVGRLLSSLSAVNLWTAGGLAANAISSAAAIFLALVILAGLVRERKLAPQAATS